MSVMRDIDSAVFDWDRRILAARGLGEPYRQIIDNVEVIRTLRFGEPLSLPLAPLYPYHYARLARQADLVAVHAPFPLADIAQVTLGSGGTPYVVHWHSDVIRQQRTARLMMPLTERMLADASSIVVATPAHITSGSPIYAFRSKCEVIPFGVRLPDIAYEEGDYHLFVGRLVPYKGLRFLLEAVAGTSLRLRIVGDGPLRGELEAQAMRLGIAEQVRFLGSVGQSELNRLMNGARSLVLPSVGRNEAFGMVQIEAMARGKPVVNTALGNGVNWVAREDREALTCKPGDPAALRAALLRLDGSAALRRDLGAAGRRRAEREFDIGLFKRRIRTLYSNLAGLA